MNFFQKLTNIDNVEQAFENSDRPFWQAELPGVYKFSKVCLL